MFSWVKKLFGGTGESKNEGLNQSASLGLISDDYINKMSCSFELLSTVTSQVGSEAIKTSHFIEHELQTVKHRLFTVIDSMADMVIIKNNKHQWITVNRYTQNLLGLTLNDFYLKDDNEIIKTCPQNKHTLLALREEIDLWERGGHSRKTTHLFDTEGNKRVFDVIMTPTFDDDGNAQDLVIVGRDISKLLRAQYMNKAAINALNKSSDVILILDHRGLIVFCNTTFLYVFGFDCPDVVYNKPISILNSKRHSEEFFEEMWRVVSTNNVWKGHITNKTVTGKLVECEMNINPIMNGDTKPIFYLTIMKIDSEKVKDHDSL